MLTDSHCHLTAPQFDTDRDAVLERATAAGVVRMVTVASDTVDSRAVTELIRFRDNLWGAVGVHPHEAGEAQAADIAEIGALAASEDRVVAVGETGLDFYYDNAPRSQQIDIFERQVEIAESLGLPLVVHSRDADDETAAILRSLAPGVSGVLHCFTGGTPLLEAALQADWYVSFSGIVSFRKFDAVEQMRMVPRDRILMETDSPYLAPVPMRGKRNEPAFVTHVCQALSQHLGETPEKVARVTGENTERLFDLTPSVRT